LEHSLKQIAERQKKKARAKQSSALTVFHLIPVCHRRVRQGTWELQTGGFWI
jgi:hypothetical protein